MINLIYSLIAGALLTATGCAQIAANQAQYQAKLEQFHKTVPVCSSEKECTVKWEAAQLWVTKNTGYKIQVATSVLIETYNSVDSTSIAARVTREPLGNGRYKFVVQVWYDNMFGCMPNALDAQLDFNRYVGSFSS